MAQEIKKEDAIHRIVKINTTLREAGKSWKEIEALWAEWIQQAREQDAAAQNFGNTPGDKHIATGEVYIKSKNQSHGDSE